MINSTDDPRIHWDTQGDRVNLYDRLGWRANHSVS